MHLLPELTVPALLGMDFLHHFGLIVDFKARKWCFGEDPLRRYPFSREDDEEICCGISDLTPREDRLLKGFLAEILPAVSGQMGTTTLTRHYVEMGGHPPIRQRSYLVSPKVQEVRREEVDRMLREDIIKPSYSKWSNPVVMVQKSNGKYHFCLDFRKVNAISKKDAYSLNG